MFVVIETGRWVCPHLAKKYMCRVEHIHCIDARRTKKCEYMIPCTVNVVREDPLYPLDKAYRDSKKQGMQEHDYF